MSEHTPEISAFLEICRIPRPSGHPEKITAFIRKFAEDRGLECETDEYGNTLVRRPGKTEPIMVQAHIDMVPAALPGMDFDFVNRPITPIFDGDWIRTDGTTLGADDGVGMALMMAAIDDPELKDVTLEALFTQDEEIGASGAYNLKDGWYSSRYLLNIDSAWDGTIVVGAAGAIDVDGRRTYATSGCHGDFYRIDISGFKGGHSGVDIHLPRANAAIVLAEVLGTLEDVRLVSFSAGDAPNAIPSSGSAIVCVPAGTAVDPASVFEAVIDRMGADEDRDAVISVSKAEGQEALSRADTADFLELVSHIPHGVIRIQGHDVVTSTNMGTVRLKDGGAVIRTKPRSSYAEEMTAVAESVTSIFKAHGFETVLGEIFPAWAENPEGRMVRVQKEVFEKTYGREPNVIQIHAGLECSFIKQHVDGMQAISIGPEIIDEHTPGERVSISSFKGIAKYVKNLLLALGGL